MKHKHGSHIRLKTQNNNAVYMSKCMLIAISSSIFSMSVDIIFSG